MAQEVPNFDPICWRRGRKEIFELSAFSNVLQSGVKNEHFASRPLVVTMGGPINCFNCGGRQGVCTEDHKLMLT